MPPLSLWNIVKNAIGKDLTRIPVPVNFCEPLSMVQRFAEEMEYADLLNRASECEDPMVRLQYVAAFAVSGYASTDCRVTKPFNSLLGETFENVCAKDGYRYLSEQVSHHPPITAIWAEGPRWRLQGEVKVKNKFWGKSMQLIPEGVFHVFLHDQPSIDANGKQTQITEHYSWKKVTTNVHNIIMGKLWIDHEGTLLVRCHQGNIELPLQFHATGWRASRAKRVDGKVDEYRMDGFWSSHLESSKDSRGSSSSNSNNISNNTNSTNNSNASLEEQAPGGGPANQDPDNSNGNDGSSNNNNSSSNSSSSNKSLVTRIWQRNSHHLGKAMYNFGPFTLTLNELCPALEARLCPTDSRLRPDQRAMEEGLFDQANALKSHLEEQQRVMLRCLTSANATIEPRWFVLETEPDTKESTWKYKGGYWEERRTGTWTNVPSIYNVKFEANNGEEGV